MVAPLTTLLAPVALTACAQALLAPHVLNHFLEARVIVSLRIPLIDNHDLLLGAQSIPPLIVSDLPST